MKGKLLSYEEVENLKEGDKVWVEYNKNEFNVDDGVEKVENGCIAKDSDYCKIGLMLAWFKEGSIKIYEWIEDDEQTITKEIEEPKAYKGSEIIHMIEEGILKDDDIILDRDGDEWDIKDFKTDDEEREISCFTLFEYAPFTIKQIPLEVDFQSAMLHYIKGKEICSLMNGVTYKYYKNECGKWRIETVTEEEIKGNWWVTGK